MSNNNKETVLEVGGMTCSSCVRHVEGALKSLDGIHKVDVKLKEGKVRVEHDERGPSLEAMVSALDEAGYESRAARGQA